MHKLRMLGGIGLTVADGSDVDVLLRQPKLMALLAYLAMPQPGTWHRRDALLAAFWPDFEQSRARTSLRNALYTLRRNLDEGAIRTRGDDEVSVDPALVTTDVAAMADDLSAGRFAEALSRYGGEFLPALYVAEADGFEQWLERERFRLQGLARRAASSLVEARARAGDVAGAIEAAHRGVELAPDDETTTRRLIALLDDSGDRAQAVAVYERFRKQLSGEFGVEPSAETLALVETIRARQSARPVSPAHAHAHAYAPAPAVAPAHAHTHDHAPARRWLIPALAAIAVVVVLVAARGVRSAGAIRATRSMVVLPMENATGDTTLDYIASGLAENVAHRLEGIGGLTIRSGARTEWPVASRRDLQAISREFGMTILLRTNLRRVRDSLEVNAAVLDVASSTEKSITARRFTLADLPDVESQLAAAVAGAVFRAALPEMPSAPAGPVNPESYRLTLDGWYQLLTKLKPAKAKQLFQAATDLDPSNARAWAGLSSTWASQAVTEVIPFDVGAEKAQAAAARALALDSLQGTPWANLAVIRTLQDRKQSTGLALIARAKEVDPANPEVFMLESVLYRLAWQFDKARDAIRMARQLAPLSNSYLMREANVEHCANRPNVALELWDKELVINPADSLAMEGRIRALAALGRYNDAIVEWRALLTANHDDELMELLRTAHDSSGYWTAKHAQARRELARRPPNAFQAPKNRIYDPFTTGDYARGYAALDSLAGEWDGVLYRLPCNVAVDEVRRAPRFQAMLARIGGLPK